MSVPFGTKVINWKRRSSDGTEAFTCSKCGKVVVFGETVDIRTGYSEDPTMFCTPCVTPSR